jgi:hypothetical protein
MVDSRSESEAFGASTSMLVGQGNFLTSTGKILKTELRQRARAFASQS